MKAPPGRAGFFTGPTHYGCSTHRARGLSVCANAIKVPRTLVESLVLASIQRDLFTEDGLAVFTAEVTRLLAEQRRTQTPDLAKAKARLQAVEQEIAHIMTANKAGIFTTSTKTALEQAEAERARLLQTVQGQHKKLDEVASFLPNMVERFRQLVEDLATVTQFQVDKARGMLRELVGAVSSSIRRQTGLTAISWRNWRETTRAWCGWSVGLN